MNSKILVAFIAGAVLASGIVYVAVRPEAPRTINAMAAAPAPNQPPDAETSLPVTAPTAPVVPETPTVRSHDLPPDEPAVRSVKPAPATRPRREVAQVAAAPPAKPVATPPVSSSPAPPVEANPSSPPLSVSTTVDATPAPPSVAPPPAAPTVVLQPGTLIAIRVGETISTQKNQSGDSFLATLAQPLVVDGFVIAERGARAEGRIIELERAGKVRGVSHISIQLTKLTTSDGQHVKINTASFIKEGQTSTGTDAAKVGGGAALGAIIGAIAGGGKGAGMGAGVGGAAGAGDVLMTRGKDATIPVETKITFRLQETVALTEKGR